ncbi:8039_t:CDS:2 [Cetraspora pellucida]|uniref:8039_t:CDS:1 n=1 Tax=Cetraspora pellucida TaxID=1433469 RepID=A0ACA9K2L7_9GLOM|nr:8039_t:CDS:2 [Cetraspora pellucida]
MTEVIEIDINDTQVANEAKDANSSICSKEVVNSEINIDDVQTTNKTEDANSSICLKEVVNSDLYSTKAFSTWEAYGIIRRCTYLCDHIYFYDSKSQKDTVTKKMNCPFLVNALCSKSNNPESYVYINKIVNNHNHLLSIKMISFEESKNFIPEMIDDIKFLILYCKFGATVQCKFLEEKYPTHPIHSKNLYAAIQKFQPTSKLLSNDAALMSNWLDGQKEIDSWWVVIRGLDEDNSLTKLLWMTPEQVENWIQFSDCVLNDVTHKTNCYGRLENVIEIWSVKVGNSITMKHHILLLKNQSHICSCLMVIQQDIVYIDVSNELFLRADKFYEEKLIKEMASPITYLCAFSQDNKDFLKESLNIIQQRKVYEELHKFVEKGEDSSECPSEDKSDSNKENQEFVLLNPKKRHDRGQPPGTKRLKSACEKVTKKQKRHCKKCGNVGHY